MIEIKNVTKKFGKYTAVNNVSLKIEKGKVLALVGESGSGKTTLSKLIIGIDRPDSGEILYNGKNILNYTKDEWILFRKKTQYIFQDPYSSLNPRLKIGTSIKEPLLIHKNIKNKKEKVLQTMEECGLKREFYNHYPHQLSGGQRQRAVIARALVINPEFVIADEPVSSLDVSVQAQILNLLKQMQKKYKMTMLFITHDFSVVRFIADRVAVMKNGKIVEVKEADNLFKNPEDEYTKQLLKAV